MSDTVEDYEEESENECDPQFVSSSLTSQLKCEVCDFKSTRAVTLLRHNNTKHVSIKLGQGIFGWAITDSKNKEREAEQMRQTWKKLTNATNQTSVDDSSETSYQNVDDEIETDKFRLPCEKCDL